MRCPVATRHGTTSHTQLAAPRYLVSAALQDPHLEQVLIVRVSHGSHRVFAICRLRRATEAKANGQDALRWDGVWCILAPFFCTGTSVGACTCRVGAAVCCVVKAQAVAMPPGDGDSPTTRVTGSAHTNLSRECLLQLRKHHVHALGKRRVSAALAQRVKLLTRGVVFPSGGFTGGQPRSSSSTCITGCDTTHTH